MKTVVLGDPPEVLVSLLAERKRLGLDRHDELWRGEYHMAPAPTYEHAEGGGVIFALLGPLARRAGLRASLEFNLGDPHDFRVPDLGFHRGRPSGAWIATAAIVVEVRSSNDESFEKFDFYFGHGVEEILIADLAMQTVHWFVRGFTSFVAAEASELLGISSSDVAVALEW